MSAVMSTSHLDAQIDITYQEPPGEILDLINVPLTPAVSVDNEGKWMILLTRDPFKTLAELTAEELRLAGLRIAPHTFGQSRSYYYKGLKVKNVLTGEEKAVSGLPEDPLISNTNWSPSYRYYSFTITGEGGISLWVLDVEKAIARPLTEPLLHDVFWGLPYQWMPDEQGLIAKFVDRAMEPPVLNNKIPTGPVVRENMDKKAPVRTYQDLLSNKSDEEAFIYYCSSKIVKVSLDGGQQDILPTDIYRSVELSPDGSLLLTKTIHRPFSYLVPYYRFPFKVQVVDLAGKTVKAIYDAPLSEDLPKGFNAVRKGPRAISWRGDKPAGLYWIEALDGGDPELEVEHRDALYAWAFPFSSNPRRLMKTTHRFSYVIWGNDTVAIVRDSWWKTRRSTHYKISPAKGDGHSEMIFDLNTEDRYKWPGSWLTERNEYGRRTLMFARDGQSLFLEGEGYSPEGNKPFIDEFNLETHQTKRLWQASGDSTYETVTQVLDMAKGSIITSIESPEVNPNYYLRNIAQRSEPKAITEFPHPYEHLKGVKKEMIHYQRDDGIDLSANLYLPAGYKPEKDKPLPLILWAYPREYKDPKAAGQVKESPHRFIRLYYGSPIYWVNRGYAILDRADFPIIGEGEEEPNDTFIPQLVANAKAAIDAAVKLGVADSARVAVGGHSYGAFMTANLLTHSNLFAAGIARSGAYNRTLTPFGFQSEERTFWEAPEVYFKMSPFMHADKMKTPLLMIHGEADNNSGTYPMQSERYYNALKGHGAKVRLVMLPYESHGYTAKKSIFHMLWEIDQWLEKFVKGKGMLDN